MSFLSEHPVYPDIQLGLTYFLTICDPVISIGNPGDPQMWYGMPHIYVVHTKLFFWDFDNDSYTQNSEIIKIIRIQNNFFKIPIRIFFLKIDYLVYHI